MTHGTKQIRPEPSEKNKTLPDQCASTNGDNTKEGQQQESWKRKLTIEEKTRNKRIREIVTNFWYNNYEEHETCEYKAEDIYEYFVKTHKDSGISHMAFAQFTGQIVGLKKTTHHHAKVYKVCPKNTDY